MTLKALIADDEPLARERLRFLLASDADIEISGECRNGREVVAAIKEKRVDVLFLDIQMPGKSGFEVVEQVGHAHMPVTVFVTAHNQYAVSNRWATRTCRLLCLSLPTINTQCRLSRSTRLTLSPSRSNRR